MSKIREEDCVELFVVNHLGLDGYGELLDKLNRCDYNESEIRVHVLSRAIKAHAELQKEKRNIKTYSDGFRCGYEKAVNYYGIKQSSERVSHDTGKQ